MYVSLYVCGFVACRALIEFVKRPQNPRASRDDRHEAWGMLMGMGQAKCYFEMLMWICNSPCKMVGIIVGGVTMAR